MNISNQDLETYADEMLVAMKEQFESVDKFKKNFVKNKINISCEQINYCLEKFLHAEFDYGTSGVRGLGRLTDSYPRLAGYYRKQFSSLEAEKMKELDLLITVMIVKAYIFLFLISGKIMEPSSLKSPEQLYEKWIPQIYTFSLSSIGENTLNSLFGVIRNDYESIQSFFKQNGMTPRLFGADKSIEILNGYVAAGVVMSMKCVLLKK